METSSRSTYPRRMDQDLVNELKAETRRLETSVIRMELTFFFEQISVGFLRLLIGLVVLGAALYLALSPDPIRWASYDVPSYARQVALFLAIIFGYWVFRLLVNLILLLRRRRRASELRSEAVKAIRRNSLLLWGEPAARWGQSPSSDDDVWF